MIKIRKFNCDHSFRIKTLPVSTFDTLNSLEILNLKKNRISHLSEEISDKVMDTLKLLEISGNIQFHI